MKIFSILLGNNVIETLNFENTGRHNSYILNLTSDTKLLTLYDKPTTKTSTQQYMTVQSDKGTEKYFPFRLHSYKVIELGEQVQDVDNDSYDTYEINIDCEKITGNAKPKQKNQSGVMADTGEGASTNEGIFRLENGELWGTFKKVDCIKRLIIHVRLFNNSKAHNNQDTKPDYQSDVELFLGTNAMTYDVVLDFGSEASQMAISNRDEVIDRSAIIDLFPIMQDALGRGGTPANEFIQYDPSDVHLYRSRFFVRKEFKSEDISAVQPWDKAPESLLKLISRAQDGEEIAQHYITLPNVKITGFGGIELERVKVDGQLKRINKIRDNYFYRSSINAFLREALVLIEKDCDRVSDTSKKRLVAFHILMPNVYGYKRLHQKLHYIQDDLREMVKSAAPSVVGIEASAVSESDASFIGNVSLSDPKDFPVGKYLILDAGKGTLDFSVIDYKSDHLMFNNLYRDGIIGAGNALSYAMLLVILRGLIEAEDSGISSTEANNAIKKYIFEKILGESENPSAAQANGGGDTAHLVRLMKLLDDYKAVYFKEADTMDVASIRDLSLDGDFQDLELGGLVQKIETIVSQNLRVVDTENYMGHMMDTLTDSVATIIKKRYVIGDSGSKDTNLPEYIVFAGRSFLLEPLRQKMKERIDKALNKTLIEKQFDAQKNNVTLKNICLVIATRIKDGTYDSRLLGEPEMLSNNPSSSTNTNSSGAEATKPQQKNDSFLGKLKVSASQIIDMFTKGSITAPDPVKHGFHSVKNMGISQFRNGILMKANSLTDQVQIGNCRYFLPTILNPGTFEIFFADGEIWTRQGKQTDTLSQSPKLDGNHVFESMFPFFRITRIADVAIPGQSNQSQAEPAPAPAAETPQTEKNTKETKQGSDPIDVFN